jgi:energy-coupling factor transporter ATP-binding protein EcfA2
MADVRLEVDQSVVTAQLLPLHPVVIEPRVAAANTLAAMGAEVDDRMVDLLCTNVDPGMPGISVSVNGTQQALSYAGRRSQLPYFQRGSRAAEGSELARSLWTLTQRFMNVHPFTTFNLCVVMYRPSPDIAKRYVKLLGEAATAHCELHVFVRPEDTEEVRQAIDSARADLTNRDIDLSKFSVSQHEDPGLSNLTRQLTAQGVRPHLAFLFDLAVSPADQFTQSLSTNLLPSVIAKWMFSVDPLETKPVIITQSGSGRLVEAGDLQRRLTSIGPPTQEHSPLLSHATQEQIADLGQVATWVAVCESGSALSMPPRIRDLHMIGKSRVSTHVTFVYATQVEMLLEPVLALLQQNTWLQPGKSSLAEFLLGTVRLATPEGLLGFYKTEGRLSKDSVLGRLGIAAVLAYLERETSEEHLIISLDTDVAREWLNLRDDGGKRADLVLFSWSADGSPTVTAIEVKTRSSIPPTGSVPALDEALEQVRVMHRLFDQIFGDAENDALTPARREILKRQVFLDALHQWDSLRGDDEERYIGRIDRLNQLFDADRRSRVSSAVFLVSTESGVETISETTAGGVEVVRLGVEWLRDVLAQQDGTQVELPAALLEAFHEVLSGADDADEGAGQSTIGDALAGLVMPSTIETQTDGGDSDDVSADSGVHTQAAPAAQEEAVAELVVRLREVFIARKAPLKLIAAERVQIGPSVIQVPFKLAQGARLATLQSQEADISRELGVSGARISNWTDEPGYAAIELPRRQREIPDVGSLSAPEPGIVSLALGADLSMNPYRVELSKLPHLLVGGTTGSGKSVFLRSLLWQLTHFWSAEEVSVVIIDAKGMADYIDFADAPQVAQFHPSVSGALEIIQAIVDTDLPHRRDIFNAYAKEALDRGVRITDLVALKADAVSRGQRPPLGTLVVIVDEFAELVMGTADRKRFESLVTRFNQIARAIGGHLIAATQRPSTDIVTGVMKSNFARLALRVQSQVDSRVILDEAGAEVLQGRGDLLFRSAEAGIVRLQGYNALGPYSF